MCIFRESGVVLVCVFGASCRAWTNLSLDRVPSYISVLVLAHVLVAVFSAVVRAIIHA
jgi:hypothetical protein